MFDALLNGLVGEVGGSSSSMEGWFLEAIALTDRLETLSHRGVREGHLARADALAIAHMKQQLIDKFAAENRATTLVEMVEIYAEEGDKEAPKVETVVPAD